MSIENTLFGTEYNNIMLHDAQVTVIKHQTIFVSIKYDTLLCNCI